MIFKTGNKKIKISYLLGSTNFISRRINDYITPNCKTSVLSNIEFFDNNNKYDRKDFYKFPVFVDINTNTDKEYIIMRSMQKLLNIKDKMDKHYVDYYLDKYGVTKDKIIVIGLYSDEMKRFYNLLYEFVKSQFPNIKNRITLRNLTNSYIENISCHYKESFYGKSIILQTKDTIEDICELNK